MSQFLATLTNLIGQKRREVSALINQRKDALAALDEQEEQLLALEVSESSESDEASEDSVSEQAKNLEDSIRDGYKSVQDLTASIADLDTEIRQLEEKAQVRKQAIQDENLTRESTGRQTASPNPQDDSGQNSFADVRVVERELTAEEADNDICDILRCSYFAGGIPTLMPTVARDQLGNNRLYAAMTQSANPTIVPTNYVPRLIELLRPKSVVRKLAGVRTPRLENGNLTLPKQTGGSTAAYVGEQTAPSLSTPTTGSLALSAKKMIASVVSSGELLRRSDPSSNQMVRDDLVATVATKEDITFIRSDGTSNTPKGLRYWANTANVFAANGTINLANVTNDLGKAILRIEEADVPMDSPAWLLAPRSARYLYDLRDGNGNLAFPEMARGVLREFPFFTSSQIPKNLGSGTNESEIILVDAHQVILADAPTFVIESSTTAAYDDGGTVRAAFSRDEVVHRIIVEHDFGVRHDKAVSVITGVTWGA